MKIFIETQDNSIKHVLTNMLENEFHFLLKIKKKDRTDCCRVDFSKGHWIIALNSDKPVEISDTPEVIYRDKTYPELAEVVLSERLKWHCEHTFEQKPCRTFPCAAVYDYLNLRLLLEEQKEIFIEVIKSHR